MYQWYSVQCIYLDIQKDLDTVPCKTFLIKLGDAEFTGFRWSFFKAYLINRQVPTCLYGWYLGVPQLRQNYRSSINYPGPISMTWLYFVFLSFLTSSLWSWHSHSFINSSLLSTTKWIRLPLSLEFQEWTIANLGDFFDKSKFYLGTTEAMTAKSHILSKSMFLQGSFHACLVEFWSLMTSLAHISLNYNHAALIAAITHYGLSLPFSTRILLLLPCLIGNLLTTFWGQCQVLWMRPLIWRWDWSLWSNWYIQ